MLEASRLIEKQIQVIQNQIQSMEKRQVKLKEDIDAEKETLDQLKQREVALQMAFNLLKD